MTNLSRRIDQSSLRLSRYVLIRKHSADFRTGGPLAQPPHRTVTRSDDSLLSRGHGLVDKARSGITSLFGGTVLCLLMLSVRWMFELVSKD
jgi:hypothetical protein